jgi:Tol biopolymer transport system component
VWAILRGGCGVPSEYNPAKMYLEPKRSAGPWIGVVGLLVGLLIAAVVLAPRVTHISPDPGATRVSALASVHIAFSRPMDQQSAGDHLRIDPAQQGEISWQGNTLIFKPAQPWPTGSQVSVELTGGARSTRILPLIFGKRWSFSVGPARIAYLWPSSGEANLYVQTLSTDDREALTQASLGVEQYSLSLDGTHLAYSALRQDGGMDLRQLDLTSGADQEVFRCSGNSRCVSLALSPGGDRLAFERFELRSGSAGQQVSGPSRVWILSLDEGGEPLPIGPEGHISSDPAWSPDGWLTYYDNTLGAIALVDPLSLPEPSPHSYIPNALGNVSTWSPDGQSIVMPEVVLLPEGSPPSGNAGTGDEEEVQFFSHLKRVDVDSGLTENISGESLGLVEDASPAYSPDGQWIAFTRKYLESERWTLGRQLWLMDSSGKGAHQLTSDPNFNYSALVWNADSSALAGMRFNQADMSQPPEIWWMGLDEGQLHILAVGGYIPQWIP